MRLGTHDRRSLSEKRARSAKGLKTRGLSPNDASLIRSVDWLDVRDSAWLNNVPTLTVRFNIFTRRKRPVLSEELRHELQDSLEMK
jgi:hypothetical protein